MDLQKSEEFQDMIWLEKLVLHRLRVEDDMKLGRLDIRLLHMVDMVLQIIQDLL